MPRGPKLCTECEHHQERAVSFMDTIIHECWKTVDVVTGKTKPTPCSVVRRKNNLCGEVGKWFKAAELRTVEDEPGVFDEPPVEFEPAE